MQKNHSLTTLILLSILSCGVLFASLNPNKIKQLFGLIPPAAIALPQSACDLSKGPCQYAISESVALTINLQPRPLQAIKPMQVEVSIERGNVNSVGVDFSGADMNMGLNFFALEKLTKEQTSNQSASFYSDQASLPICVTGKMRWIATFQLDTQDQRFHIPFSFEIGSDQLSN
jgi:hypothetical protein